MELGFGAAISGELMGQVGIPVLAWAALGLALGLVGLKAVGAASAGLWKWVSLAFVFTMPLAVLGGMLTLSVALLGQVTAEDVGAFWGAMGLVVSMGVLGSAAGLLNIQLYLKSKAAISKDGG